MLLVSGNQSSSQTAPAQAWGFSAVVQPAGSSQVWLVMLGRGQEEAGQRAAVWGGGVGGFLRQDWVSFTLVPSVPKAVHVTCLESASRSADVCYTPAICQVRLAW